MDLSPTQDRIVANKGFGWEFLANLVVTGILGGGGRSNICKYVRLNSFTVLLFLIGSKKTPVLPSYSKSLLGKTNISIYLGDEWKMQKNLKISLA